MESNSYRSFHFGPAEGRESARELLCVWAARFA